MTAPDSPTTTKKRRNSTSAIIAEFEKTISTNENLGQSSVPSELQPFLFSPGRMVNRSPTGHSNNTSITNRRNSYNMTPQSDQQHHKPRVQPTIEFSSLVFAHLEREDDGSNDSDSSNNRRRHQQLHHHHPHPHPHSLEAYNPVTDDDNTNNDGYLVRIYPYS